MSQKPSKVQLPLGSWIALAIAIAVLAVNVILTQLGGTPLPDSMTNPAEDVVATSMAQIQTDATPSETAAGTTELQPTAAATPASASRVKATSTPKTPATAPNELPSPVTIGRGSWEGTTIQDFDRYTLALSWEPAFCETRPDKPECVTQSAGRFDATNFVLHGLWPDDGDNDYTDTSYCDVSQSLIQQDKAGDWCELPALPLSDVIAGDLFILMPGATSCLQNHEWTKHGTCSGLTPETYYALSNHLTALFAQSEFNTYIADRAGTEVTRSELLNQFEAEFGPGSDQYLSLQCDTVQGTSLLTELTITLKQEIRAEETFDELFLDKNVRPQGSCPQRFRIDAVGRSGY